MAVRVATLLRLSTKRQAARQGQSSEPDIPAQRQAIAEFLSGRPDWVHVQEYQEAGVSAFKVSAEDRDVLQDALRDASSRRWDALLVWKADRLSRNALEYPMVISRLNKWGVQVWSVADAPGGKLLGLETQMDKFVRFLEGWQAETESVNTQIRVSARMRQLAQQGKWNGSRVPFGYMLVTVKDAQGEPLFSGGRPVRQLAPDPRTAPVVRELFRRYLAGEGDLALAAWLNDSRIRTSQGRTWSATTVRELLTNPLLAGRIVYGRAGRPGGEPVRARGQHEPLISEEIWERACEVRRQRRAVPFRQRGGPYALTGALRCGRCGSPMGGITRRRVNASGALVERQGYRCIGWTGRRTCPVREHRAEKVEADFLVKLADLGQPSGLRRLLEEAAAEHQARRAGALELRRQAAGQLVVVREALARVDAAYFEAGVLTLAEYREKKTRYLEQKERLEADLTAPLPAADLRSLAQFARLAGDLRANWAFMTQEERKLFVISLMQAHGLQIYVGPDSGVELRPAGLRRDACAAD